MSKKDVKASKGGQKEELVDKENSETKEEEITTTEGSYLDNGRIFRSNFPLFTVDSNSKQLFAIGGGGGSSKTGIANKVILLQFSGGRFRVLSSFDMEQQSVKCLSFHPNGTQFATGVGNCCKILEIQNANRLQITNTFQTDFGQSYSEQKVVRFDSKGKRMATGGVDGKVRIYEHPSMRLTNTIAEESNKEELDDLDIDSTGKFLVVNTKSAIVIWDLTPKEPRLFQKLLSNQKYNTKSVIFRGSRFSAKENCFFVGKIAPGFRSWICKYKLDDKKNQWYQSQSTVAHRSYHHNTLNVSRDGELLVTGTSNNTIAVFSTSNLSRLMEVKAHEFFVTGVCFSDDNKHVISVSADYSCVATPVIPQKGNNIVYIILAVLFLLLAVFIGRYLTASQ